MENTIHIKKIRRALAFFIVALFLSGFTAIPVSIELRTVLSVLTVNSYLYDFFLNILFAYERVQRESIFLLYGYDWLAFAHFVLAILFVGPYKDPVKNSWVITFGLISCVLVIPFAFIAGHFRQIPVWWRIGDCSFGIVGFILLYYCHSEIRIVVHNINYESHQYEAILD